MSTADEPLAITLCMADGPGRVTESVLQLAAAACVADVLRLAGLPATGLDLGIWGRPADAATRLHAGDRIEVYRPLRVDPKVARRERFKRQGARATGLFARQRAGGKSGY